jgi:hypothetical protein
VVPKRAVGFEAPAAPKPAPVAASPLRIRGRAGDGLYWALRAAGASPQVAAQYLAALATKIDVGGVGPGDSFGRAVSVTRERGQWFVRADGLRVLVTLHPSALLRMEPGLQASAYDAWVADLALAAAQMRPEPELLD